mgnify:CR=1 FL=1
MVVISVVAVDAVAVADGQRVEDGLPAVDLACHVLSSGAELVGDKVELFQRGLLVWEVASLTYRSSEPTV